MTIDDYIQELMVIQHRLLTMPESEALKESFVLEQQKLESLISQLSTFSKHDQESAREIIEDFSEKLTAKLTHLRARLEELSQTMQQQEIRQKSIKAYGQSQRLL